MSMCTKSQQLPNIDQHRFLIDHVIHPVVIIYVYQKATSTKFCWTLIFGLHHITRAFYHHVWMQLYFTHMRLPSSHLALAPTFVNPPLPTLRLWYCPHLSPHPLPPHSPQQMWWVSCNDRWDRWRWCPSRLARTVVQLIGLSCVWCQYKLAQAHGMPHTEPASSCEGRRFSPFWPQAPCEGRWQQCRWEGPWQGTQQREGGHQLPRSAAWWLCAGGVYCCSHHSSLAPQSLGESVVTIMSGKETDSLLSTSGQTVLCFLVETKNQWLSKFGRCSYLVHINFHNWINNMVYQKSLLIDVWKMLTFGTYRYYLEYSSIESQGLSMFGRCRYLVHINYQYWRNTLVYQKSLLIDVC